VSRIFLSHSSSNNAEAVAVRDWLAGNGWKGEIFLDDRYDDLGFRIARTLSLTLPGAR
jgi:hypothetical protein